VFQTPLYDWHVAHGGRMVDFAGWSMPIQYTSIVEEHNATRQAIGLFDVSHMGRLQIFGPDASRFVDHLVTRRVIDMQTGQIRYGLVCNETGGILDDVLVYRLAGENPGDDKAPTLQMVVNASNREKIVAWFNKSAGKFDARFDDVTTQTAMLAVQGPKALRIIEPLVEGSVTSLRYYNGFETRLLGHDVFLSRTGYTGEDGCEIICSTDDALAIWEKLVAASAEMGGLPAGLGARDTLRLEAGMPLYGHELSESINPIQAGLSFAVTLSDREFIGRSAIESAAKNTQLPVRVGLELDQKRVPRENCVVWHGDEEVGAVTSGTFSPTFQRPIAMAYVRPSASAIGTPLAVDVRGTLYPAVVVPLPFYHRGKH
jgi:aminomethyltransferase